MKIKAFALFSPLQNNIEVSSVRHDKVSVRDYAIEIATIWPGSDNPTGLWKSLYKKGYRVVPITINYDIH